MTRTRVILEMARADVLERARRPGFLFTLTGAAFLAYTVHADVWTVLVGGAIPQPGPEATGTLVAVVTSSFLSLACFYVVRGTVKRDLRTGVGSILAATPASRLQYVAGKFLSNVAVLGAMLLLLAGLSVAIEAERAGGISISGAWRVVSPSLLITGPALVAVAAVAVLFDSLPWLRGTAGNVGYFFLWVWGLTFAGLDSGPAWTDVTGLALTFEALLDALRVARPGAVAEGLTITANPELGEGAPSFAWSGVGWTAAHVARRFYWVGVGAALTLASAASLRLFDPFRDRGGLFTSPGDASAEGDAGLSSDPGDGPIPAPGAASGRRRTPDETGDSTPTGAPDAGARSRASALSAPGRGGTIVAFLRTVRGELRLLLSGHPWWWYVGLVGANLAALFLSVDAVSTPLLVAWLLPIAAWSRLGCRERLRGTESLLFSGPSPRRRLLPAQLAAGVTVALLAGAVPLGRMAVTGDAVSLAAATAGAFFTPALAFSLGAWMGTEKAFQAVYLGLWYLGPVNEVAAMDFMGVTGRALDAGATLGFVAGAAGLVALGWLGRGRRLGAVG